MPARLSRPSKWPVLLLSILPLTAVAGDRDVVARMGEAGLTVAEARSLAQQNPSALRSAPDLERLVRTELIRKAIAGEARSQGVDKRPEVAALMAQAADQALVRAYVNSIARPARDYPSEAEVKAAYAASRDQLTLPTRVKLRQIYLAGTDAKVAKQAEGLYRQASRKGADFTALARTSSQHKPSAEKGGEMGWLPLTDLFPGARSLVEGLKPGEIGKPVAGPEGYHILKLEERKAPELLPLDQARPLLVNNLRLAKAREIEAAFLENLLAKQPVAVDGIALADLLKEAAKTGSAR